MCACVYGPSATSDEENIATELVILLVRGHLPAVVLPTRVRVALWLVCFYFCLQSEFFFSTEGHVRRIAGHFYGLYVEFAHPRQVAGNYSSSVWKVWCLYFVVRSRVACLV